MSDPATLTAVGTMAGGSGGILSALMPSHTPQGLSPQAQFAMSAYDQLMQRDAYNNQIAQAMAREKNLNTVFGDPSAPTPTVVGGKPPVGMGGFVGPEPTPVGPIQSQAPVGGQGIQSQAVNFLRSALGGQSTAADINQLSGFDIASGRQQQANSAMIDQQLAQAGLDPRSPEYQQAKSRAMNQFAQTYGGGRSALQSEQEQQNLNRAGGLYSALQQGPLAGEMTKYNYMPKANYAQIASQYGSLKPGPGSSGGNSIIRNLGGEALRGLSFGIF